MNWWEREKMLSEKDREVIDRARRMEWWEIHEEWADTDAGKETLKDIIRDKYHAEEAAAGMI